MRVRPVHRSTSRSVGQSLSRVSTHVRARAIIRAVRRSVRQWSGSRRVDARVPRLSWLKLIYVPTGHEGAE
eukprot:12150294-Alexandrium_andersonii.AAC.1